MRRCSAMVLIVLAVPAFFLAATDDGNHPVIDDLGWMTGHWKGRIGGADIEEVWLSPTGGQMLGINRTVIDGASVAFELLRIEDGGDGIVYLASPGGRCPATGFRLETLDGERAVFANPDHDFPQRIEYRRQADTLHARIEGTEDGEPKSIEWAWTLTTR